MPGTKKLAPNEILWSINEWQTDLNNFEVYLVGETEAWRSGGIFYEPGVEYQMATRLIKNMRILSNIDPKRPILIHMKSEGGYWTEGIAIYDAVNLCPNKVTILDYCQSMSMTSIIIQAADKRVLMPNSYFMFHEGTTGYSGTVKQVHSGVEWEKKTDMKHMLDIYVRALKKRGKKFNRQSTETIREMLQERMNQTEEVYLTAEEAIEWGFADEIFDGNWENLKKYPRNLKKK